MTTFSNKIAQDGFRTRKNYSKNLNPLQKEKPIVLFNNKTTTEAAKKQGYLNYAELVLNYIDTNKDGKVTKEEFIQGKLTLNYERKKNLYRDPEDSREIIKRTLINEGAQEAEYLDTNKDGYISKEEYAMFVLMCDNEGGIPADGKFTISEEEETAYKIRMGLYETPLVNKYKNNPFLEK